MRDCPRRREVGKVPAEGIQPVATENRTMKKKCLVPSAWCLVPGAREVGETGGSQLVATVSADGDGTPSTGRRVARPPRRGLRPPDGTGSRMPCRRRGRCGCACRTSGIPGTRRGNLRHVHLPLPRRRELSDWPFFSSYVSFFAWGLLCWPGLMSVSVGGIAHFLLVK